MLVEILNEVLSEKMEVNKVSSQEYAKYVAAAYTDAPKYDSNSVSHWKSLNKSNYLLWKRLLSKIDIVFTTESAPKSNSININGKDYKIIQHDDPYETQAQMKADVAENKRIFISIDYSDHPVFSVEDNIVFRTVHDYIVHILGNKPFGLYGELQAYNLHAKLVPVDARPAIFTEVVGQVCWHFVHGDFPVQKVAVLDGFDYVNVGLVSDEVLQKYNEQN